VFSWRDDAFLIAIAALCAVFTFVVVDVAYWLGLDLGGSMSGLGFSRDPVHYLIGFTFWLALYTFFRYVGRRCRYDLA